MAPRTGLVLVGLLLLTGCVWLRLATVKDQLADLDRFVDVPPGPRLELRFRERPLRDGDPERLIGAPPSTVAAVADGHQQLTWRFRRIVAEGQVLPASGWFLDFDAWSENGRITAVAFPEQVYRVLDRERCIAMLRAFGRGTVDTQKREVQASITPAATGAPVTAGYLQRSALLDTLGPPLTSGPEDGLLRDLYRYRLDGTPAAEARLFLDYDPAGAQLKRMRITINGIWISLHL